MVRPDLEGIPPLILPVGYRLRACRPDDAPEWLRVVRAAYGGEWADDAYELCILSDPSYRADRVFCVADTRDALAGTIAAFQKMYHGEDTGYVHMLAVAPRHQRRGLGAALLRTCLLHMRSEGRRDAALDTEASRLAAVRLHLAHGFLPFPENEREFRLWGETLRELGRDALAAALRLRALPVTDR